MKKISISFAMAQFIFISYLILALFTTFIVVNQAVKSVNIQQQALIALEMQTVSDNYHQFLTNHLIILNEQSKQPIITQELMQSNTSPLIIAEHIKSLRFLDKKYDHSLLDFDGNIVYTTNPNTTSYHHDPLWKKSLLKQATQEHIVIRKIKQDYYWVLIAPVKYNYQVEGFLITIIPIDAINEQHISMDNSKNLAIDLIHNQQNITSFGHVTSGIKRKIEWPELSLVFNFTFDDTAINEAINELIIQLSLLILFSIFVITLFAYYLGHKYIVTPILELASATNYLEDGDQIVTLKSDIKIKELSNLFSNFNRMCQKVSKREQALISSKKLLMKSHDDLKQSESQRMESEKMASLGVLAAGVAHEINNPIGFVKSNIDILKSYWNDIDNLLKKIESKTKNQEQKMQLENIYEEYDINFLRTDIPPLINSTTDGIGRVTEIVQSLKSFARADAPEKVMADINEGLNATIVMARNELKYHCQLDISLEPLPLIFMHPGKLNQVFMNLLINAGQSIEDRGIISIKTYVENDNIIVEILDTGCGIKASKLNKIFTPFYTSKPIGQGTGLGLSISHRIIEQHGGTINVTSTWGEGSCFMISLPINHEDI